MIHDLSNYTHGNWQDRNNINIAFDYDQCIMDKIESTLFSVRDNYPININAIYILHIQTYTNYPDVIGILTRLAFTDYCTHQLFAFPVKLFMLESYVRDFIIKENLNQEAFSHPKLVQEAILDGEYNHIYKQLRIEPKLKRIYFTQNSVKLNDNLELTKKISMTLKRA